VNFRARRRAAHPVRLTAGLTRGRGADRQLRGHTTFTQLGPSARSRALLDDLERRSATEVTAPSAPGRGRPVGRWPTNEAGRLVGRWVINESGRLVIAWSLEPVVEAAPAIRLTTHEIEGGDPPPAPAVRIRRSGGA
jgi:hypothetical protein